MDEAIMIICYTFFGLYVLALTGCLIATIVNVVIWYKNKKEDFSEAVIFKEPLLIPVALHLIAFIFYLAYQLGNYLLN